jgi:glycerol-3-phosphate O-acyltransferase/dihydroxyacetone phosphate acyltransferase
MHRQIATGTFDAPSWDLIRAAKTATPIYAPLGTAMSLGDYVRVTRAFLEVFKATSLIPEPTLKTDLTNQEVMISDQLENKDIIRLKEDLQVSQYHTYYRDLPIIIISEPQYSVRRTSPNCIDCGLGTIAFVVRSHVG